MSKVKELNFTSVLDELNELGNKAIALGKSEGASQIQVSMANGLTRSIAVQGNSISGVQEQTRSRINVRSYIGKKMGMATTTSLNLSTIENTVINSIKLAKLSPEDEQFVSLAKTGIREPILTEGLFDENIANLDPSTIIQDVDTMIQGATEVHDKANLSGKMDINVMEAIVINSNGVSASSQSTSLSANAGVSIPLSPDNVGVSYDFGMTRTLVENLDYFQIGKNACVEAKSMLNSKVAPSKSVPVLFDQRASASTLGSMINNGVNAYSVMTGSSYFTDKIGDKLSVDEFTLWDDPHVKTGMNSRVYDVEGVPTSRVEIFKSGVLQSYVTDTYTSNRLGLENTGNAQAVRNLFRPRIHQGQIAAGSDSYNAMLEDLKEGVLIRNRGMSIWGTSPEISVKIDQGYWVENGEIQYPLKNSMIGTNIYDFLKNISAISKEIRVEFGRQSPAFLVDNIAIAGAGDTKKKGPVMSV
ncbi:MAG: TldD/PmbA family protein [Candidatus Heimdallarchaeota archaeon]|nr:TldD/PmbA family protein [Candidatus Heimdallarchaeota archaeon]